MEDLKKKVNEVYGWSVEDGKPKPPKQDLPQAVKERADYFWEMTEDGMTFIGSAGMYLRWLKKPLRKSLVKMTQTLTLQSILLKR